MNPWNRLRTPEHAIDADWVITKLVLVEQRSPRSRDIGRQGQTTMCPIVHQFHHDAPPVPLLDLRRSACTVCVVWPWDWGVQQAAGWELFLSAGRRYVA